MNKFVFRLLVVLMSLSLLGIIFVQVYWFNTSFENNEEQFKFHVKQVLGNVAQKLQQKEEYAFYSKYNKAKDSSSTAPKEDDLLEYGYYQRNAKTNQTIVYSNSIVSQDYDIFSTFFDKNSDSIKLKNFISKRKTEIFNNNSLDNNVIQKNKIADLTIEKAGSMDILNSAQFEIQYKDIAATFPIQERISIIDLNEILANELEEYGIKTPFEFNVYSKGLATKIKSERFRFDKYATYSIPIFVD
ncbi:MAG: two-component sensor histidine kinase, partial [Flavobacterium sp.]|nr:two-component sensor histidine kinase [Flavobacterium sp.]